MSDAYVTADYVVDHPDGRFVIKVGQPCPRVTSAQWAYLTAWNPRSQPLPRVENDARQAELLRALGGYVYFHGAGQAPDASWSEDSVLVLDITQAEAEVLGRRFEQSAILVGGPVARLVYLE